MSVIVFELKDEHIKLLKQLSWTSNNKIIVSVDDLEEQLLFGENNVYEAVDMILNGKPENFDPFNTEDFPEYSPEQIAEWDKLLSELPTALNIILYNCSFETGTYKTKFNQRLWKKLKNTSSN